MLPSFVKRGWGRFYYSVIKIPLYPPLKRGNFKDTNLLPNRSIEQAGFFKFFDFFRRVTKP